MWINTCLRTLLIDATAQGSACIEAIPPEEFAARWHVNAHVVTVGIVAEDRAHLVIHETKLQNMSSAAICIERDGIVHYRVDILRGFIGAEVGLDDVQTIMRG